LRAVYHIRQEGESWSVLYKTDIPVKHKKCSIKTGIGVRISSDLVFDLYRIQCSRLSGFYTFSRESCISSEQTAHAAEDLARLSVDLDRMVRGFKL